MQILLEILGGLLYAFFGALVGVLYPPRSPAWARAQTTGICLAASALVVFFTAFLIEYFAGWTGGRWLLVGLGSCLWLGYLIVGNVCRKYHEGAKSSQEPRV